MGLIAKFKTSHMKDPVHGTATVTGATGADPTATSQNYRIDCVVQAEGVPAFSATHSGFISTSKWPYGGQVLPVTIDRANPSKWVINWDQVQTGAQAAREQADALAARMRGEPPSAGDAAAEPAQLQASLERGTEPDTADELTKLADLHDRGVLTDAEFESQKAKILAQS